MHVSLQSTVYLGTCVAINAYAAYSNPTRWITAFAIGVLLGTISGRSELRAARDGYQPGNNMGMGCDAGKDREVRENAVKFLADSMPGLLTTAINLLALGLISQRVHLPSGWNPRIGTYFCDFAAFGFGTFVGALFQLDILRRDQDPKIQELLANTVI
jgi:hypothetical protein